MAPTVRLLSLLCLALFFSGCARNFVKPDLTSINYAPAGSMESRLDFDLSPEPIVLPEYFARRLDRRDIALYALRVSNSTPDTVWLGKQDITVLSDSTALPFVAPRKVYRTLKQPVAIHALWFLLGPFVRTEGEEKVLDYHPLGVAAVAWGVRNGIVAYTSNREVKKMVSYSLPAANIPLPPATTIYLLVPLSQQSTNAPLQLLYLEAGATEIPTEQK